jgi:glycosyltransferase involved in cell wall biosynthesis
VISVIITAYKNTEFIEEAIDSIVFAGKNIEFEILIGIDNCELTLEKCLKIKNKYEKNVKFLYFLEHSGTYVIRNTLVTQAKYDKLLFFDSDDVMNESLLYIVNDELNYHKLVRYNYITFSGQLTNDKKNENNTKKHFHTGTFGILKHIFLNQNGFEPWVCAADGEFYWRVTQNNVKSKDLDIVGLYYRRHGQNLTAQKDTNMTSPLRKRYHDLKNKKIQTNSYQPINELKTSKFVYVSNESSDIKHFTTKNVSIIIPTYKNTEYIDECINSILKSGENHSIELLIGVDACQETLHHIKTKEYPDFVKFYYFNENVGPYVIKNSLLNITNSENILFFDSDDIITPDTIPNIINNLSKNDCVLLSFQTMTNNIVNNDELNFAAGVFAIKKDLILKMNGFEPWKVSADSEFIKRLHKHTTKIHNLDTLGFYYRQHPNSLTKRRDTGMTSKLRREYGEIKKDDNNPSTLYVADFTNIDFDSFVFPDVIEVKPNINLTNILRTQPRPIVKKQPISTPIYKPKKSVREISLSFMSKPKPI